jgi:hypothetical protein
MCKKLIFLVLLLSLGLTIGVASGQSTVVRVNFQLRATPPKEVPLGYIPDYGDVFGNRGNGWSYGWTVSKIDSARDRDAVPDQRYDTLNSLVMWNTGTGSWEIAVPNGTYNVYIVGGDASYYDSTQSYLVEDVTITDPTPYPPGNTTGNRFDEYYVTNITVADGRLTIAPPTGWGTDYIKICFIHIADVNVARPLSPPDRALWTGLFALLQWAPGAKAAQHDVYIGGNFNDVNDANTFTPVIYKGRQGPNTYNIPALTPGATYYWRIDEVNDVNIWKGDVCFFIVPLVTAHDPNPIDGAICVDPNTTLSWTKGALAANHNVYFGDNYNNVLNATTSSSEFQITLPVGTTTWDPPGLLSLSKTYYWRIEEVNNTSIWPGDVWSFKTASHLGGGLIGQYYNNSTLSGAPTITRIDPRIDFDWGLGTPDPLITNVDSFSARWTGEIEIPASGEWTFWLHQEHQARLWVNGQLLLDNNAAVIAWYSAAITLAAGSYPIEMEYAETGNIALVGLLWQGPLVPTRQIIPTGAFTLPLKATGPNPANNATGVEPTPTLSWSPGNKATEHDVYFGDNYDDVNDANSLDTPGPTNVYRGRQDPCTYDITTELKWNQTYYWRIDEVNEPNIWRGNIWQFTTRDFNVADDFERYNNTSSKIQGTWIKGGGGIVGYPDPNYAERSITHGGAQSMPFDYNNIKSPYYSDVNRTFDSPQNWTAYGLYPLKSLTLWFRGYPERVGSFSYTGTANPYAATIYACGADIGNVADLRHPSLYHDECRFGYKAVTSGTNTTLPGSTTTFTGVKIIAKVDSVGNTGDSVGKAGVMIRDSLDANSVNGFMCVRRITGGGYGVAFQYRSTGGKGATTIQTDVNDTGITLPCWVALTLQTPTANRNVRAYYSKNSTNGTDGTWYPLGTVQQFPSGTMYLPKSGSAPIYIGLAATPQSDTATRMAKFSSVTLTTGAAGAWASRDISIKSNIATPLYVTLQDSSGNTAKVTHPNSYIVLQNTWQEWDIALSDFKNKNPILELTNIKKITIGTGNGSSSSGAGTLYFDDIRVYMPRCVANAVAPDFTGSGCLVDNQDLRILTDNWLISGDYQVTPATSWDPNNDVNLVARYRFDGNYNDSKGTNNGDPCNTSVAIVNDATRGQVASFDGVNSYIALKQMDQNDFTLSAWIKASTPGAQAGTRAYQGSGLIWSDVSGDANDFILAVLGTKLAAATGPSTNDLTSIGDVVTGQWVHVAMVRTRSTGKVELYINGMLDRTTLISSSTGSLTANSRILIGANTVDGYYYKGLIDDVWIYDRALTLAQVARLAGKATAYNVPMSALVTNPAVNLNNDGRIDIRDYAILASKWLETLQWPQQ